MLIFHLFSNMILVHCGVVLMFLSCVKTTQYIEDYREAREMAELDHKFSFWPSMHNAIRKRQAVQTNGVSEGGGVMEVNAPPAAPAATVVTPIVPTLRKFEDKALNNNDTAVSSTSKTVVTSPTAKETPRVNTVVGAVTSAGNVTMKPTPTAMDLSNPGVAKRGAIVFGGFLLLALAYYVFYRRNHTKTESNNQSTNDANEFRYGVLQSDDRRDNLELSQIPLTMESDDDDDEDLEIFDLGQKKKSLSYINLQTNDEDLVFDNPTRENVKDNLLLDIEDSNGSETLINWSSNGSKSIL